MSALPCTLQSIPSVIPGPQMRGTEGAPILASTKDGTARQDGESAYCEKVGVSRLASTGYLDRPFVVRFPDEYASLSDKPAYP